VHFQFTVRRLIGLTAAVAAVTAIAVRLDLQQVTRFALGSYCIVLISWCILRGPSLLAHWSELRGRRRTIIAGRKKILDEMSRQKRRSRER
jgi:hypothetical protein